MKHSIKNAQCPAKLLALLIFANILFVSCAQKANDGDKDPKALADEHNKAKFEDADKERDAQFLEDVSITNLMEIQLGKLAQEKGMCSEVKELGRMMEKQHTDSQREIKSLAVSKIITLPDSTSQEIRNTYQKLNEKTGRDFDLAYCKMMEDGHKQTIDKFEKELQNTTDPDIKSMVTMTLPVLRAHLEHTLNTQDKCDKANHHSKRPA